MTMVRNFLGKDINIPEDRLYSPSAHFWFRRVSDAEFEVGVTEPGIALTGGLVELEVLADPGAAIVPSEEVAFATTRKAIKYFMSPVGGAAYAAKLAASEHATDMAAAGAAAARAGKISPTCKSIYSGIKQ